MNEMAEALFREGVRHFDEGRLEEAARCFERAARLGHPDGQGAFAWCLVNGDGVEKDETAGVEWAQKAADQGDCVGRSLLGTCHFYGKGGLRVDKKRAAFLWLQAARQGERASEYQLEAQHSLGLCFLHGEGVNQSDTRAVHW